MRQPTLWEISPANDWCQRWRHRQHSWTHKSAGGFNADDYTVEAIPEAIAKDYIITNHYAASYSGINHRFGLFDRDQLVGVAGFGSPGSPTVLPSVFPELRPYKESCELNRLVLDDEVPGNAETWFIARCFEQLVIAGFKAVVSFSDPVPRTLNGQTIFAGHIGTIYQAKGAVYTGKSKGRPKWLLPNGTVLDERNVSKVRNQERGHEGVERRLMALGATVPRAEQTGADWLDQALSDLGAEKFWHSGQHRYAFPLGSGREKAQVRIKGGPFPYPKKEAA